MFLHYDGLTVCSYENMVYMLVAELGYLGATPQGCKVGISFREPAETHPDIRFDEAERLWCAANINGLSFDIVRPPTQSEMKHVDWVDEEYEVTDARNSFVLSISIHKIKFGFF